MNITEKMLDLAVEIQQVAAPTFAEAARSEFVRGLFVREGLKDVSADSIGNVFARLPGCHKKSRALVVSAHLDTVFSHSINLQAKRDAARITAPGIGDNSLAVAALFGILWSLRERKVELAHDVWFAANVGEEGLGDLCGMRAVVDRFGEDVIGYLVLEGLALGHVYHRAIGVRRYRVTARTAGGHSWSDYGQPSAVHELAELVTQLNAIRLPREPRTTLNVGRFDGGTGINVLASEAKLELDLRSEDSAALSKLIHQVEDLFRRADRDGVRMLAEVIGQRPAGVIDPSHPFVSLGLNCLSEQGINGVLTSGSTDANIPLSRGIPSVVLGVTTGGGAHTTQEYINLEPVQRGMDSIVRFVERVGAEGG